jgi:hypothetical protein
MKKKTAISIIVFLVFVIVWGIVSYQTYSTSYPGNINIVIFKEAYGQPFATTSPDLAFNAPLNESSAASWASNNTGIGEGTPLLNPFENEVIQDDEDNDGFSTCDDPILQISVQCPVGWELDEEDSISFNNASDFTHTS